MATGGSDSSSGKIAINFAPAEVLEQIPGIKRKLARAIVAVREGSGNITPEILETIARRRFPSGVIENIDFTQNTRLGRDVEDSDETDSDSDEPESKADLLGLLSSARKEVKKQYKEVLKSLGRCTPSGSEREPGQDLTALTSGLPSVPVSTPTSSKQVGVQARPLSSQKMVKKGRPDVPVTSKSDSDSTSDDSAQSPAKPKAGGSPAKGTKQGAADKDTVKAQPKGKPVVALMSKKLS